MKLSILIPTLASRRDLLKSLLEELELQRNGSDQVEIITWSDNGEMTTGRKRQNLIESAKGEYVVFVDDDDFVSYWYIENILKAIETKPDVVTFYLKYTTNMKDFKTCHFGMFKRDWNHPEWFQRIPNHLCPVKRELALKVGYSSITIGEDADYAKRLRPHLKTDVHIDQFLYTYFDRVKK